MASLPISEVSPHTTQEPEPLLTSRKQAAVTLGLSERTIDLCIAAGELDVVRVGRRVLVKVASLRRLAERREVAV